MAVRSDAASDRVSYTASSPPNPSGGFTATWWAYLSVDRNDFSTMLRLHSSSGGSTTMNVATGGGGETPCIFSPGNTGGVVGGRPLVVGQWSRVAVTVTGTSGTIYVADTNVGATTSATGTVSGGSAPTGFTVFGRAPADASEWFNGRMAYLRLWATVLNQTQIEAEWAAASPVVTSNLWASYPLLTHTDINDASGNGRHLTAGSTSLTTEADPPVTTSVSGTGVANLGSLAGTAQGVRGVSGSAASALGGVAASGTGVRAIAGSAAAGLGSLSANGVGARSVAGSAAALLGGVVAPAVGTRGVLASAGALLGPLAAAAAGRRGVAGGGLAVLAFAGQAIAARTVVGQALAPLGAVTATALQAVDQHDIELSASLGARRWAATVPARRWTATLEEQ